MYTNKPPIQILVEKLRDARGPEYSLAYAALQNHLRMLTETTFLAEVARVDDPGIFRYLQAAGLPYSWQQIASTRWKELIELE